MLIKEFLENICEQIKYKPIRKSISDEIEAHINEIKEEYTNEGMEEKMAEKKAINAMGDATLIGKELNKIHKHKLDWKLIIIISILLCFGFLVAFIRTTSLLSNSNEMNYMVKFIFTFVIGIGVSTIIYFFDYTKIKKYSNLIYILATLLLIFTKIKGFQINGETHIRISLLSISPSSIVMPLYIIAFCGFINKIKDSKEIEIYGMNFNIERTKIIVLSLISLILMPSTEAMIILGLIYLIIATAKLAKLKEKDSIIKLWGISAVITMCGLILVLNSQFRMDRIIASFYPGLDPNGSGYVGMNQKKIINNAKLFGKANDIEETNLVTSEGTNFAIMSVLANYGWIITIAMILAIILLSIKLIINSKMIKDDYGRMLTLGIASLFILESIFNILMNFNLGIKADFNLPFISYGCMDLLINMVTISIILSIYRKKDIIFNEKVIKNGEIEE